MQPESKNDITLEAAQAGLDLVNRTAKTQSQNNATTTDDTEEDPDELTLTRGWIAFDEENVVVLKEQSQGRQALVVYDFT